jgi:hypothetical protein
MEKVTSKSTTKPCFEIVANLWFSYCSKDSNIFYKLPEHLYAYFNIVEDRKKYGESVSLNIAASQEVRQTAQSETRFVESIPVQPQPRPPSPLVPKKSRSKRTCGLCKQICTANNNIKNCKNKCGLCKRVECPGRYGGPGCVNT